MFKYQNGMKKEMNYMKYYFEQRVENNEWGKKWKHKCDIRKYVFVDETKYIYPKKCLKKRKGVFKYLRTYLFVLFSKNSFE